jgi:hypothetical protein
VEAGLERALRLTYHLGDGRRSGSVRVQDLPEPTMPRLGVVGRLGFLGGILLLISERGNATNSKLVALAPPRRVWECWDRTHPCQEGGIRLGASSPGSWSDPVRGARAVRGSPRSLIHKKGDWHAIFAHGHCGGPFGGLDVHGSALGARG